MQDRRLSIWPNRVSPAIATCDRAVRAVCQNEMCRVSEEFCTYRTACSRADVMMWGIKQYIGYSSRGDAFSRRRARRTQFLIARYVIITSFLTLTFSHDRARTTSRNCCVSLDVRPHSAIYVCWPKEAPLLLRGGIVNRDRRLTQNPIYFVFFQYQYSVLFSMVLRYSAVLCLGTYVS